MNLSIMSHLSRFFCLLVVGWVAIPSFAATRTVTPHPAQPSSRDDLSITFHEEDWFELCIPEFQEVVVAGNEITIRIRSNPDHGCLLVVTHNPYSVTAPVGPLPSGTYTVNVEAPKDFFGEIEVTSSTLEVVQAVQCGLPQQPAATLLLPYFEVDLDDPQGRNTLFSVSNFQSEATLAHAVVWTNLGVPILSFDLIIPALGLQAMSVRDLIQGNLPSTSPPSEQPSGFFENCKDPLLNPAVDEGLLATLLTGGPHPDDGLCYANAVEDGSVATGYITVDVVRDCSNSDIRTFRDVGYFQDGGGGLATNDNVLTGDFFLVDATNDFAQGEALVSVVADARRFGEIVVCVVEPCPPRAQDTFYGFENPGNRMPLPRAYRSRFLRGGGFSGGTDLLVWSGIPDFSGGVPSECGSAAGYIFLDSTIRSEAGDAATTHQSVVSAYAFRAPVGGELFPTDQSFGQVEVSASVQSGLGTPSLIDIQMWAMPLHSASGRYSVGLSATPVSDFCRE